MLLGPIVDPVQEASVAAAVMRSDNDWMNLRALEACCSGEITPEIQSALIWVLRGARNLSFLNLSLHRLAVMPRMTQLRHLQLQLDSDFCQVAESLTELQQLQTLYLRQIEYEGLPRFNPVLDLAGLPELHSVSLRNIVPSSLTLPEGAPLHLWLYSLKDAREGIWRGVAHSLQSIILFDGDQTGIATVAELPRFLQRSSGLKSIFMALVSLGSAEDPLPLSGSLLQVNTLVLECTTDMCVRVPAGSLPWRLAKFVSNGALQVDFLSVGDFLGSCPAFAFGYRSLRGLDFMYLCECMTSRDIKWASSGQDGAYEFHSLSTPHLYRSPWHDERLPDCICNACPVCSDLEKCGDDAQFGCSPINADEV